MCCGSARGGRPGADGRAGARQVCGGRGERQGVGRADGPGGLRRAPLQKRAGGGRGRYQLPSAGEPLVRRDPLTVTRVSLEPSSLLLIPSRSKPEPQLPGARAVAEQLPSVHADGEGMTVPCSSFPARAMRAVRVPALSESFPGTAAQKQRER